MTGESVRVHVYQSKADAAYGIIRAQILDGTLAAGSVLNQEHVAADLGISTTPVREAMRRLESEGLVLMPEHRDVRVAPLDLDDFLVLLDVRAELDTLAAGLAAKKYVESDRAAMESAVTALAARPDDRIRALRDFYAAIYRASHDSVLIGYLDHLWDQSDRYQRAIRGFSDTAPFPRTYRAVVDAVLSCEPDRSEAAMREHLAKVRSAIELTMEELSGRRTASGNAV